MSLATALTLSIKGVQQLANDNFATPQDAAAFPYTGESWASGTAVSQADLMYRARITIGSSSSQSLDLSGVLTDRFGTVLSMARVKLIAVYNRAAIGSGFAIQVGGAASNQFSTWVDDATGSVNVRPGGVFLLTAPDATAYAVTAGTGDILKLNNSNGSSVDVDVMIIGASA